MRPCTVTRVARVLWAASVTRIPRCDLRLAAQSFHRTTPILSPCRIALPSPVRPFTMAHTAARSYEDAVAALNSLQSNASVLALIRGQASANERSLPEMRALLGRLELSAEDINALNVIHITGTKGKGSTAAFAESLLRAKGYKTGLYTSPHLVEVRERIRIDGKPIDQAMFAKYFWKCWDMFVRTKEGSVPEMPTYFRFLTAMAFVVFREEKVDASVIEVGIGGTYDCTNVVERPLSCGITALGFDHMSILGDTIGRIASHKGGICKDGVPAVTAPQPEEGMEVLLNRAKELGGRLFLAPNYDSFQFPGDGRPVALGLAGEHQKWNASVALCLVRTWEERMGKRGASAEGPFATTLDAAIESFPRVRSSDVSVSLPGWDARAVNTPVGESSVPACPGWRIDEREARGLAECRWPGRCQELLLEDASLRLLLDGAHTPESLQVCAQWYRQASLAGVAVEPKDSVRRVLLFNCSSDRDAQRLLQPLFDAHLTRPFDEILFCPNYVGSTANYNDAKNDMVPDDDIRRQPLQTEAAWVALSTERKAPPSPTRAFSSIAEAASWVVESHRRRKPPCVRTDVLVTGSLHLVGGMLKVLNVPLG